MAEKNQHIKLSEMARLLSRSVKQFKKDIKTYDIRCIKLGRTLLFNPDKVNEYLYEMNSKPNLNSASINTETIWQIKSKNKNPQPQNNDSAACYKRLVGLE